MKQPWMVLLLALAAIAPAFGQDQTAEDREEAGRTKICRDDTARYTLVFAGDKSGKFDVKEVLKWANPVRNGQLGVVSLWLKDGRAQAMSTVFNSRWPDQTIHVYHEFQSLATRPVVATFEGEVKWSPAKAGVTFRPIPDSPEPAETPVARLRQMRGLSRDFSAHSISSYEGEVRWELRMLPQPLYRYETSGREVLDGAVFSFVSNAGTDPELIVLIEARRSGDKWAWQYAAARFSDHSLYLSHRDRDVWSFVNEGRNSFFAAGVSDIYRLFQDRQLATKLELGKELP